MEGGGTSESEKDDKDKDEHTRTRVEAVEALRDHLKRAKWLFSIQQTNTVT